MSALYDFLLINESAVRLGCFITVFLVMSLWELVAPRRQLLYSKMTRWTNNLALVLMNSIILRLVFPVAAVGIAVFAENRGWGILNYLDINQAVSVIVSIIVMDAMIYLQHVMMHAVPVFWRLHRVHHADPDFDVTTGARFHPIEIILSMLIKFAVIIVLGPPAVSVMILYVLLNVSAMFNHSNVRLKIYVVK